MHIVLLGAGGMGRAAALTAARFPEVRSLTVADLDPTAAQEVARACGPKASARSVDVRDASALHDLLSGADFVLNTVGPYYRFGVPVLRAAIGAGTHYLDICDDPGPTLDLLALHGEARAAGVTAVVGLGASPGLSNLLAATAATELTEVHEITTGWDAGVDVDGDAVRAEVARTGRPSAALLHWLHESSGRIRAVRGGQPVDLQPLREFPLFYPGLGHYRTWTVGHPEPLTLARRYALRASTNVMHGDSALIGLVRELAERIDAGTSSVEDAADLFIGRAGRYGPDPCGNAQPLPGVFAVATGLRDGQPMTVAATIRSHPPGGMGGATGVPLALGVRLLAAPAQRRPGVFAPEDLIAPPAFFDLFAPLCEGEFPTAGDLLWVTSAQAPTAQEV